MENLNYPKLLRSAVFEGGIAPHVNGQLLVSLTYYDKNDVAHRFNYLTGGELKQIIPLGDESATYYPVLLIK